MAQLFNDTMEDLVRTLVEQEVDMNIRYVEGQIRAYFDSGFYKSNGSAYLVSVGDIVELRTRYDGCVEVKEFIDVVEESHCWYQSYKSRGYEATPVWVGLYNTHIMSTHLD